MAKRGGTKMGLLLNASMSDGGLSEEELTKIRSRVDYFQPILEDVRTEKVNNCTLEPFLCFGKIDFFLEAQSI
jgi:hypothetical protein